ncbi:MAG: MFS transporter [Deltaproteobacteria bacterium]|nr:MFS transporter [Deltaproteobacteria bacterium]
MARSTETPLWTREFIFFNVAVFLAFINIAVFFSFEEYLRTLPIDPQWFGLLIGLFSAVALVLRPFISPFSHPENARGWISLGTLGVMAALAAYGWAATLGSMMALRLFHGAAHVFLATALMTVIVQRIPPGRSGQAFGLLSIITLLPYAVIPPILKVLMARLGGYPQVLAFFAGTMILIFPLIFLKGPGPGPGDGTRPGRLSRAEIWRNLRERQILLILTAMLLFYSGYALIFFFLAGYARNRGVANPGLFFTLSTVGEIGIRLIAARFFDRLNKKVAAGLTLLALAAGYLFLARVEGAFEFFALGALLGLGWGVVMPILSALLYDRSQPKLRAFNTNLGLQMFQGGFFIGPLAGALALHRGGYDVLYLFCALLVLAAGGMIFLIPISKEDASV